MPFKKFLKQIAKDDLGGTAIEYGLIAALIVIAIIVSVQSVANSTVGMWGTVSKEVESVK